MEDISFSLIQLRVTDSHAHLNESVLAGFAKVIDTLPIRVMSNSVDPESSLRNIELSKQSDLIIPFVGIHPEIFKRPENERIQPGEIDVATQSVASLLDSAKGVGEIGLDPSYGQLDNQKYLLNNILSIAERRDLPIAFHCRETVADILNVLGSYRLHSNLMFHWFSGSQEDLRKLHDRSIYTSYGPSIIFSNRMAGLVQSSNPDLILVETDSPTQFRSILNGPSTPLLVNSVAFKIGLILNKSFESACEIDETNVDKYLST